MAGAAAPSSGWRSTVAGTVGNGIEWYDFAVYGASATVLAQVLTAGGDAGLTAFYVGFALSFLVRPAGALLGGRRADRLGRRGTLAVTLLMMTAATVAIGLLPPYAVAGAAAPALMLALRAVQAFASGGELAASIPFLLEHAPTGRRGLWGGLHSGTVALGIGAGTAAVALTAWSVDAAALTDWAWRVPFLLALPLGLVGVYVRLRTTETPSFLRLARAGSAAPRRVLRSHGRAVRDGFVLTATLTSSFNLWFVFLPAHLVTNGHHDLADALAASLVGVAALGLAAPLLGLASDHVGRRPVLVGGATLLVLAWAIGYPVAADGRLGGLVLASACTGLALAHFIVPAALGERLPTSVRAVGIALAVGASTGVVGGTAPLVADLLDRADLEALVPAYGLGWAALAVVVAARWPAGTSDAPDARAGGEPVSPVLPRPADAPATRTP